MHSSTARARASRLPSRPLLPRARQHPAPTRQVALKAREAKPGCRIHHESGEKTRRKTQPLTHSTSYGHSGGHEPWWCLRQLSIVPEAYLTVSGLGLSAKLSSFFFTPAFRVAICANDASLDRL